MKPNNRLLYGGAIAAVLLAGAAGFGIARMTPDKPAATSAASSEEDKAPSELKITPAAITTAGITVETVSAGGLSSEIITQAHTRSR